MLDLQIKSGPPLGIKDAKWLLLLRDSSKQVWFRGFYYKKDVKELEEELRSHFRNPEAILSYYGTHYWKELT